MMKIVASTQGIINHEGLEEEVCFISWPGYSFPLKILVSEPVTRQETDEEFLTRLGILFESKSEMAGLIAALNPKRYKKKQIEVEPAVYRAETEEEILQRAIERLPVDARDITVIEHTDLPYDGYRPELRTRSVAMRNSWINPPDKTSPPVVDMVKARQAKMDLEWRPVRNKMLADLDIEYQKADELADNQRKIAIAAQKAKLRDMPQDFAAVVEAITDPVELDNFDPVDQIIASMESV